MMKAQQAPPTEARHSCALAAVKLALMKAHSTSAGTDINRNHASSTVIRMFSGEENRRERSHAHAPTWVLGGGSPSLGICVVCSYQRSTSAMRLLYQFMKIEIDRLTVRYAPMMMRMPSMACPVWFSVVLTTDTMSG